MRYENFVPYQVVYFGFGRIVSANRRLSVANGFPDSFSDSSKGAANDKPDSFA